MTFGPEVYRTAAEEHLTALNELYRSGRYVLAHYVAGLAVECMLMAYRRRQVSTFDERHDLWKLARNARFLNVVPEKSKASITAALGEVVTRWQNPHRFRSEHSLRSYLLDRKLHLRIKGDFVKESARRIVNAALELVALGAMQWKHLPKK
jgi:HEPN domain-containing protein